MINLSNGNFTQQHVLSECTGAQEVIDWLALAHKSSGAISQDSMTSNGWICQILTLIQFKN